MLHQSSAIKDVVLTTTMFLIIFTGCQTSPIGNKKPVNCNFKDHLYYVPQINGCKECDRCWDGREPVMQGVNLGIGPNGATKCPPCKDCSEGTYNPDGDRYWKCLKCTSCSDSGLYEVQACSPKEDTKCSNSTTPRPVKEIRMITPSDSNDYDKVGHQHEDKDLHVHKERATDIVLAVIITIVVIMIIIVVVYNRRKIWNKFFGRNNESTTEETMPLNVVPSVPDNNEGHGENTIVGEHENPEDTVAQLRSIAKNEKSRLLPKRTRHVSFDNYDNALFGLDTDGEREGGKTYQKRNPAFQRQMSHPGTDTEKKQVEQFLETEDEKKRPSESFIRHLSKVLAPRGRYKLFAVHMGLPSFEMDLLQEEHEHTKRDLNAEDISFVYTSRTLQRKRKLSHRDIYEALRKLKLYKELENVSEKRKKSRI